MDSIFHTYDFGEVARSQMDRDGHVAFPGLLTEQAKEDLTTALSRIEAMRPTEKEGHEARRFSAEHDAYFESLIAHPQMLGMARSILGDDIRYDHCVSLTRLEGDRGTSWHAHEYGEENWDLNLGFVRIFFYVNGFEADDAGLTVVPGSHLFRDKDAGRGVETDEELRDQWIKEKTHPVTGEPLKIVGLSVPEGTVVAMWTHALHAVTPKKMADTRWTVVYAYRNPGLPSNARWITDAFERKPIAGAEGLMSLS